MENDLKYAVLAIRAFQIRHDLVNRYRHAKTKRGKIDQYQESVTRARRYIRQAREAGFRGSVTKRLNDAEQGKIREEREIPETNLPDGKPRQSTDREIREEREISLGEDAACTFSDGQWGSV